MKLLGVGCSLLLLISLGCNSAETPAEVSGTVLLGSEPLAEGNIIFEALDKSTAPGAGIIKDGKYTIQVLPGSKKVKIQASKPGTKIDPVMKSAMPESILGPEFNDKTTLKAEIKPGKNEKIDFQVKQMGKK
ncbi:MAG: hypothetical protein DWH95_10615 [Planctomycetota bacterium]|jgi:hypothetical protein|nr:hypothetical protein [bacterium]NBT62814.1 hypothetical protein [Planctomycetia bacterium]RLS56076.1 MAG: hypothetical protein DWH95_10615 [Planctomycetota bacterium]